MRKFRAFELLGPVICLNLYVKTHELVFWKKLPLKTNFGGEPGVENENVVFNTVLLECLVAGIVVWGAYQASLTSELSIIKLKLPFIDLQTLHESDYK